jgi:PAS domain S-box-containing protein
MLKRFFSLSIRTHLLLLVFISILPSLIIILYNGLNNKNNSLEIANADCSKFVYHIRLRYESIVTSIKILEYSLSEFDIVKKKESKKCVDLFNNIILHNPEISTLAASDSNGNVFANAISNLASNNVSDRKYFIDAKRSREFSAGGYMIGRTLKKPLISFSTPVFDEKKNIIGVIQSGVDIDNLNLIFSSYREPPFSTLIITDYKGIILYSNESGNLTHGQMVDSNEFKAMQDTNINYKSVSGSFTLQNNIYFYEKVRFKADNQPYSYILLKIPEEKVYAGVREDIYKSLIFFLTAFLLAAAIAWLYAKFSLTDRLQTLVSASRKVMDGDFGTRVNLKYKRGEINELAEIFNLMAISLQKREDEIKATLNKIKESEEKYRSLFEIMVQGVIIFNSDGRIISVNPGAHKILGIPFEQMIGKTIYEYETEILTENKAKLPLDKHPSAIALKSGKSVKNTVISIFNPVKKRYLWILLDAIPEFKEDNKEVHQVYLTLTDITELKELSESLRTSEENYRVLVENIGEGISIIDMNNRFTFVNPATADIFGISPENLINRSLSEFISDVHKEDIINNLHKNIFSTKENSPNSEMNKNEISVTQPNSQSHGSFPRSIFEFEIVRYENEKRLITLIATPKYDKDNNITGILGIFNDITEIRRTEQERLKLQNLESIAVLAGGIAHDFRNILTVIQGHTNIVQIKKKDPEISKNIISILEATKIAIGLTHQLFTFAQGGTATKELLSIRKVLEDTAKYSLFGSDIKIDLNFSETQQLNADPIQIKQAIQNIITNAKEAMPNGGKVTISTADVINNDKNFVMIKITDTGKGIPKENIDKIFDPYFSTKTRATEKGSGFGLSVTFSIIKKHGGIITAESQVGIGTSLIILLPAVPNPMK